MLLEINSSLCFLIDDDCVFIMMNAYTFVIKFNLFSVTHTQIFSTVLYDFAAACLAYVKVSNSECKYI